MSVDRPKCTWVLDQKYMKCSEQRRQARFGVNKMLDACLQGEICFLSDHSTILDKTCIFSTEMSS